jgi:hypothetical protein
MIKVAYLGAKTVGLECLKFLIEKASGNNIEIAAVLPTSTGTQVQTKN